MRAYIELLRPWQWNKNVLVLGAVLFGGLYGNLHAISQAIIGFVAFCCLSGAVYALNDVRDCAQDAQHPRKRNRPIPSGRISRNGALAVGLIALLIGLALSALVNTAFLATVLSYLLLTAIYNAGAKGIAVLDVFLVAGGFVLRTLSGAHAIGVPASGWLLGCTMLLALFFGFGKRRSEVANYTHDVTRQRPALAHYDLTMLDQFIAVSASSALISYTLYCIISTTAQTHDLLKLTIAPVLYGIFRYLYLIHRTQMAETPEILMNRDRHLQICLAIWLLLLIVAMTHRGVTI